MLQNVIDRLIEKGRCYEMEMNVGNTKVMRISRQPSPIQIMIHQKQPGNVQYLNHMGSMITNDAIYRVSQEECARLREGVPYVKVYRYNPKNLCPKLNGYGDNGQRKVWSSGGSTHCTCQLTTLSMPVLECGFILRQFSSCSQ